MTSAAKKAVKAAKPRGRPFAKGTSGNPRGKRPGVPNKVTRAVKAIATSIVDDPTVQATLLRQAQRGRLAPATLVMLFYYAYGKPKDTLAVEGGLEALTIRIVDEYKDDADRPGGEENLNAAGSRRAPGAFVGAGHRADLAAVATGGRGDSNGGDPLIARGRFP